MRVHAENDLSGLAERLAAQELPAGRTLGAWRSLLHAHATLMRRLERDLEAETGLALADFDVLAQLALAGGGLRHLHATGVRVGAGATNEALIDQPGDPAGHARP
jgi:hypothetical protein